MNDEYKKMLERFEQICQNAKKELCGKEEKEQKKRFIEKIDKGLTISEYDEIEYWLANVEVLDNTDYILNNRKAKILVRYLKEKQQEKGRLNNIINTMDKEIDNLCKNQKKEIERLNNIIKYQQKDIEEYNDKLNEVVKERNKYLHIKNELEKYVNEEYIYDELGMKIFDASKLQDKLQELKGSDKSGKS